MPDPIHSFEGDPLKLTITLKSLSSSNARATSCKVVFKRSDTGEELATCEGVAIENKKVKPAWTPEVQEDDYPVSYPIQYAVFINEKRVGAWYDHVTIWAKTIRIEAIDHETSAAVERAEFSIDGEKGTFKTAAGGNDAGKYTFQVKKKPVVVHWLPPFMLKSWETGKRDTGRVRRAKLSTAGEYKAKIYAPGPAENGVQYQDGGYRKQYVNLEYDFPAPPYLGQKLLVEVGAQDDESKARRNDEIYVSCSFSKSGKRTARPKPQLAVSESYPVEDWVESEDGKTFTGVVRVQKDQGRARFVVDLGYEGGETWEIKVGRSNPPVDDSLKLQVWRRVYYQMTVPASGVAPDVTKLKDCMKEVFIDVAPITEVAISDTTHASLPVWIDGADCGRTAGTKYLLGGNTKENRSAYEALLDPKGKVDEGAKLHTKEHCHDKLTAHFIICADQCDFYPGQAAELEDTILCGDGSKTLGTVQLTDTTTAQGIVSFTFQPACMKAHFFARSSQGENPIHALVWFTPEAEGEFPLENVSVSYADDEPTVTVDTSANRAFHEAVVGSGYDDFGVAMGFEHAALFNGEAFGDRGRHLLIATEYDTRTASDISATMAHELGHALGMCLAREYEGADLEAARKDHGFQYQHSGAHCAYGMGGEEYKKALKKPKYKWDVYPSNKKKQLSDDCKCVMYGIGAPDVVAFCVKCQPYFKAQSSTQFLHTPDSLKIPRSSQRR